VLKIEKNNPKELHGIVSSENSNGNHDTKKLVIAPAFSAIAL